MTDEYGNTVKTEEVTLKIKDTNLAITRNPESQEGAVVGTVYTFYVGVTADTEELTYQWYYSNNGTNWGKINDDDNEPTTLNVKMMAYRNGYQYRCVITDVYGNVVTSDKATLTK